MDGTLDGITFGDAAWTCDRMGLVRDGGGKVIGRAHHVAMGDLLTTQAVARHFAASKSMAEALRRLIEAINAYHAASKADASDAELEILAVEWDAAQAAAIDVLSTLADDFGVKDKKKDRLA